MTNDEERLGGRAKEWWLNNRTVQPGEKPRLCLEKKPGEDEATHSRRLRREAYDLAIWNLALEKVAKKKGSERER